MKLFSKRQEKNGRLSLRREEMYGIRLFQKQKVKLLKAKDGIESETAKALSEIHEQVATLSVDIASKLLGEKLSRTEEQGKLISKYLKDIDLNKN
jgi:hypothetical protein